MGNENMNFKDIPGYEGLYQVSDCGQVKSLERLVKHYRGGFRVEKEKILNPRINPKGYEVVSLCKEGVQNKFLVHRLVVYAHSYADKDLTINHIDENKRNNHISNLEYCTSSENTRKHRSNNPKHASIAGKKGGSKSGEIRAKKFRIWKYVETEEVYTMEEASIMMYVAGQAPSISTWRHILSKGVPQDRFVKI